MKLQSKTGLIITGILAGLLAVILAVTGNPKNMAICIACFLRDTAGALKLHGAAKLQYFRPETAGILIGAFLVAVFNKEFKSTAGSATGIRFFLGMIMMICALVFLGCPTRMILRMAAGDISAYVGLVGFLGGILTGIFFLKKGFSLGRNHETKAIGGVALPFVAMALIAVAGTTNFFFASKEGPGSMHAPFIIALAVGLAFGVIAQLSRMCFAGAFRDVFLMRNFDLFSIIAGMFVIMLGYNLITNNFAFVAAGPIAHTNTLMNILGAYGMGFAAILLGGCPLRQLVLAGQGSQDSAMTVLGMLLGAAIAHNFSFAGNPADLAKNIPGGPAMPGQIAVVVCIVLLFIVAFYGIGKLKQGVK